MRSDTLKCLAAACCLIVLLLPACKKKAQDNPATTSATSSTVNRKVAVFKDSSVICNSSGTSIATDVYRLTYETDTTLRYFSRLRTTYTGTAHTTSFGTTFTYNPGMVIKYDSGFSAADTLRIDTVGRLIKSDDVGTYDYYPGTARIWHHYYQSTSYTYTWDNNNIITMSYDPETLTYQYLTNNNTAGTDLFQATDLIQFGRIVIKNKNLVKTIKVTSPTYTRTTEYNYTFDQYGRIMKASYTSANNNDPYTTMHFYTFEY